MNAQQLMLRPSCLQWAAWKTSGQLLGCKIIQFLQGWISPCLVHGHWFGFAAVKEAQTLASHKCSCTVHVFYSKILLILFLVICRAFKLIFAHEKQSYSEVGLICLSSFVDMIKTWKRRLGLRFRKWRKKRHSLSHTLSLCLKMRRKEGIYLEHSSALALLASVLIAIFPYFPQIPATAAARYFDTRDTMHSDMVVVLLTCFLNWQGHVDCEFCLDRCRFFLLIISRQDPGFASCLKAWDLGITKGRCILLFLISFVCLFWGVEKVVEKSGRERSCVSGGNATCSLFWSNSHVFICVLGILKFEVCHLWHVFSHPSLNDEKTVLFYDCFWIVTLTHLNYWATLTGLKRRTLLDYL